MTTRRPTSCALCDNVDLASVCPACVNRRLYEYNVGLRALKSRRDTLYARLSEVLIAKGKIDDQCNWRVAQTEKLARLKEKLHCKKEQLLQGKVKVDKLSKELKAKYGVLEAALLMLDRARVEQLEKYYPNLICTQTLGLMAITSERLHKQSVVMKQICKLFPQRRELQGLVVLDGPDDSQLNFARDLLELECLSLINWCDLVEAGKDWVNVDGEKKEGPSGQFDQICNARLPRGLDPHSVPSEELGTSLGYMVQLLNLFVRNLGVPAIHNTGFAGSCSRIWQRDSYWDTRPSSRSNEYPLFIPRQNYCSANGENSWSDRSYSNFGVASMESERKPQLDSCRSSSFNYASASQHSVETHKDLQRGISLLKKSVACITAYCYNSLCLDVPSEVSTFEAFSRLLGILSSSKEVRSAFSLKMACSRSSKQVQQMNKSIWNVNSAIASSTLLESAIMLPIMKSVSDPNLRNSTASFLYATDLCDNGKSDTLIDGGWDLVEAPTFPPPPSQNEDIEHWTRAMFIDATKK